MPGIPFKPGADPRRNVTHGPKSPKQAEAEKTLAGLFSGDREFIREQALEIAKGAQNEIARMKALEFMAAYSDGKPTEAKAAPANADPTAPAAESTPTEDLEGVH